MQVQMKEEAQFNSSQLDIQVKQERILKPKNETIYYLLWANYFWKQYSPTCRLLRTEEFHLTLVTEQICANLSQRRSFEDGKES